MLEKIKNYIPLNEQEEKDKKMMIELIEKYDDIFERENDIAHMTASCWVTNKTRDKVLMAYHNIYDSFAWLGGHADGDKNLLEVAKRELKEESGLDKFEVIDKILSIEILPVSGHIKNGKYVSSHLHLNVTYLFIADEKSAIRIRANENSAIKWLSLEEAITIPKEKWIVNNIYKKLLKRMVDF